MEEAGDEVGSRERVWLLEVIRQRIRSGYYDSPRAMDMLARVLVHDMSRH